MEKSCIGILSYYVQILAAIFSNVGMAEQLIWLSGHLELSKLSDSSKAFY